MSFLLLLGNLVMVLIHASRSLARLGIYYSELWESKAQPCDFEPLTLFSSQWHLSSAHLSEHVSTSHLSHHSPTLTLPSPLPTNSPRRRPNPSRNLAHPLLLPNSSRRDHLPHFFVVFQRDFPQGT